MKTSIYIIFSCLSVIIIAASIWFVHQDKHDYEECAKAAQIAAYDDLMLDAGIDAITPARQAQYKQSIIDNQIKCSDLGAQWGMTDIAFLGYIAGLVGLVFLGITVFETRNAAESAARTLEVARNSSEIELQPYLNFSDMVYSDTVDTIFIARDGIIVFNAIIDVINKGKTPIHIMKAYSYASLKSGSIKGIDAISDEIQVAKIDYPFTYILPEAGGKIYVTFKVRTGSKVSDGEYEIGKIHFSIRTVIEYDDVFSLKAKQQKKISVRHWGKFTNGADGPDNRIKLRLSGVDPFYKKEDIHPSKR